VYNWKNNPDLSSKSDGEYAGNLIDFLTFQLESDPNNSDLIFSRGNGYLDLGKYQEAIIDYSQVIEIDDQTMEISLIYNNRGICYRGIGDFDQAIKDFNKAIKINQMYRDAFNNRGMLFADLGKYQKAIENYTKSIEIDPNYWYAYNNRAMSYWESGDIQKAMKEYEIVRRLVGH
jgi:tetratricopeptide (TPR) repeat protein